MTLRGKLTAQIAIVINLAVERDHKASIVRNHGLVARVAGVNDRQASMTETDALSVLYRGRCPHAFIVATTMLDGCEHRADERFRILTYESGYSAHAIRRTR